MKRIEQRRDSKISICGLSCYGFIFRRVRFVYHRDLYFIWSFKMALETLNGIKEIGGFTAVVMDELREQYPDRFNDSGAMDYCWFEKEIRPNNFIYVRKDVNSIAFTLQKGPIKEVGVNGCQVDSLIDAARLILEGLNKNYPCDENRQAIESLEHAIYWLEERTRIREQRGVEGTSKP